jgi:hypothetical protein
VLKASKSEIEKKLVYELILGFGPFFYVFGT